MVNHAQDFVAVKKYKILQFSLIPSIDLHLMIIEVEVIKTIIYLI